MRRSIGSVLQCVSLALVVVLTACSSKIDLLTDLTEADANESLGALYEAGIPAEKRFLKEGITLSVSAESAPRALQVLQTKGLPRKRQAKLGEVFKKENLISTPLEERARYLYALSQEIENTLSQFEGVIAARVHVVLPERIAPGEPIQPSSAAVYVKHDDRVDMGPALGRIRQLVANSIPGLQGINAQKVTVVLEPVAVAEAKVSLEEVWGIRVELSSASALRVLLWTMLLTIIALMAALIGVGLFSTGDFAANLRARIEKMRNKTGKKTAEPSGAAAVAKPAAADAAAKAKS